MKNTRHDSPGKKARSKVRRIATNPLVLFVTALVVFLLSGCTTTLVPPRVEGQTASVAIVDYGYHASLVLPDGPDGAIEFEYGEWRWFALGQSTSPRLVPTLFWPTQGALGRRILSYPPDLARLREEKENFEEILSLEVSVAAAEHLRKRLTARYEANIATEVENNEWEMTFVKDPARYSTFHNCNHRLALWLRELGCETRGHATFARFRIRDVKN
ncbi:MAG: DUF2459 domain-containing protein [Verrucomicrobia bacterium]|nr:DUF2459 domain-containing protein [Verrucomicrobiota bacterium]